MHPGCHALSHALLEGQAEGAVAAVAAFTGQLLGSNGLVDSDSLTIEIHKLIDAEVIDVSIVGHAMAGEELAEIVAINTNGCGELLQGQVMLQVKLSTYATLVQQLLDKNRGD